MKKLALAAAAALALTIAAPVAVSGVATDAQAQTVVKKKVIIKHGDRGLHRGWRHSRHYGAMRTKVVRHGHGHHHGRTVVIKKKVVH